VGETIKTNIGKKCKTIIIDRVLSNIQVKFWKCNIKHGIFSITWNNAIIPQAFIGNYNSYCNIILGRPHA
jgi:hypothetical protein